MNLLFLFLLPFSFVNGFGQKMDSIQYENGYLYFHDYGVGDPVIVLSGGPGANYQQMGEVAINVGKNQRAILLEQRGTGRSIPKPYDSTTINLKTAHADIHLLLDHLKIKEAKFLGHSWGAMLAMSFASEFPDRVSSLILVSPGPFKFDKLINEVYRQNQEVRLSAAEKKIKHKDLQQAQKEGRSDEVKKLIERWELIRYYMTASKWIALHLLLIKEGLIHQWEP